MNAFCLIHFGDKKKYIELELYLIINLRKFTKNHIIYLYSINDTPISFIDIMKKYCDKVIAYDDKEITYNINYVSIYNHFNVLRTCNFIFAYQLLQYKKIALIESDMIILNNIDDIFNLKCPSVLILKSNILKNYKISKKKENYEDFNINGGIMLIKPSLELFNIALNKINIIKKNNSKYPNESLFLLINDYIYNLPYKYNGTQYQFEVINNKYNIDVKKYLSVVHFNSNEFKHLDIIRDNYLEKIKNKKTLYYFVNLFKNLYYEKNKTEINKIIKLL